MTAVEALSAQNISFAVKDARLLSDVSFSVAPGEWLSIIGPNGAGKSTLLRAIAGAVKTEGTVAVDGKPLSAMALKERAKQVAWVPQTPVMPAGMKVLDYVLLGRTPHLHPLASPSKSDIGAAQQVLDELNLGAFAERTVETLSGGERQRVVVGRALVQDTPIILLDEPTSALDLGHQQDLLLLLDRLRSAGDRTIISTMHDLTLAGHFADRVMMLAKGKLISIGTAAEVLTTQNIAQHYNADVAISNVRGTVVISPRIATPTSFELPTHFHQQDSEPTETENPPMSDHATTEPTTDTPVKESHRSAKSLVLVNTGDGKGKSSSAFGMMIRGVARDWNVAVVQFVKSGEWNVGEEKVGRQLGVDWHNEGEGFTWNSDDLENDKAIAQAGWDKAQALISSGEYNLIILDELTYLINWGWIEAQPVYNTLSNRPEHVSVVVTGRDAPQGLIDVADTVSEVVKVKHAFDNGILAKRGLDY